MMFEMQEIMEVILKGMQKKYRGLLEIERLTKELSDLLSVGDRESVQLILNMRQDEIERVHEEDGELRKLLGALNSENREYLAQLMNGKEPVFEKYPMERQICQLAEQTRNVLDKTISVDKVLSIKLAGKESYYQ